MDSWVGPIQPFTGAMAQEDFGHMIDHVHTWIPKAPIQLIKRRINHHLRQIESLRSWAGLFVRDEFYIPAVYDTGTVTSVVGSDEVQASAASLPYNDMVNTTLAVEITAANEIQDITPDSMSGINMGDWLLFDEGEDEEEWVLVHSVTSSTFSARPTQTHDEDATITRSRLSGRALRIGYQKNLYPIIGITQDQRIKLDHAWSHAAGSDQSYQIVMAYITMPPGLKVVWSIVNMNQGWTIKPHIPMEVVQRYDAWRAAQGWASAMVNFTPDHIGRIRYELYPTPTKEQGIPYIATRKIPDLVEDTDCPPTCIPSGIIVNHALGDLFLFDRKSEYYDPVASREFRGQAVSDMNGAMLDDDNAYMQNLEWVVSKYGNMIQPGADFWQSHEASEF